MGWRGTQCFGVVGGPQWPRHTQRRELQHPEHSLWHCPQWKTLHLSCKTSTSGPNQDLRAHVGSVLRDKYFHRCYVQGVTCSRLFTEAPVLLTQRRVVSVFEGADVQLSCNLRANYLPTSHITWFNNHGSDIRDTSKYMLLRTSTWANLTVRDTDETQDSGEYRCTSSNAVGGGDLNITLVVKSKTLSNNVSKTQGQCSALTVFILRAPHATQRHPDQGDVRRPPAERSGARVADGGRC